uniref:Putative ovule protein n=1 Tax=Solanum chacoense TaxID=4108 RepID=A0A0V0I936_SOLCH
MPHFVDQRVTLLSSLKYMDSFSTSEYFINKWCWFSSYRKSLAQQRGPITLKRKSLLSVNLISRPGLTSFRNSWLSPEILELLSPHMDTMVTNMDYIFKMA